MGRKILFYFSFLEMHLQGIGDQTVTSIYTELSSLVLAYLNRDNVMYLATCRNCLRNIPSSAG